MCVFVCVILSGVCVGRVFILGMCISVYVSVRACCVYSKHVSFFMTACVCVSVCVCVRERLREVKVCMQDMS